MSDAEDAKSDISDSASQNSDSTINKEEEEEEDDEETSPQSGGLLRPAILDCLLEPSLAESLRQQYGHCTLDMDERLVFRGGHEYIGNISRGRLNGDGEFRWKNGISYTGEFSNNELVGNGTMTWPQGDKYIGEFKGGLRHGKGKLVCCEASGGATYTGEWEYGKRNGTGIALYKDGGTYDGEWKDGLRHGRGIMQYSSGNRYEGDWKGDKRSGIGVMTWASPRQLYRGSWVKGKPHGFGECLWLSTGTSLGQQPKVHTNNWYRGNWVQGTRHGEGSFYYADGSQYSGEWKQNKKHSARGIFVYPDGRVYCGRFENDRMLDPAPIKPSDSPGSMKVALHINDLLSGLWGFGIDGRKIRRDIDNVLLRWNKELRKVYYYCCHLSSKSSSLQDLSSPSIPSIPIAKVATAESLWTLFYECAIPDRRLSIAQINRILFRIQMRPLTGKSSETDKPVVANNVLAGKEDLADTAVSIDDTGDEVQLELGESASEPVVVSETTEVDTATDPHDGQRSVGGDSLESSLEDHPDIETIVETLGPMSDTLKEISDRTLHDPTRPVLFREYVELLVRIADHKFKFEMGTLCTRVSRLLHSHIQNFLQNHDEKDPAFSATTNLRAPTPNQLRSEVFDESEELNELTAEPQESAGDVFQSDSVKNTIHGNISGWYEKLKQPSSHPSKINWPHDTGNVTAKGDQVTQLRHLIQDLARKGIVSTSETLASNKVGGGEVTGGQTQGDAPQEIVEKYLYEPLPLNEALHLLSHFLPLSSEEEERVRYGLSRGDSSSGPLDSYVEMLDYEMVFVDVVQAIHTLCTEIAKRSSLKPAVDQVLRNVSAALVA